MENLEIKNHSTALDRYIIYSTSEKPLSECEIVEFEKLKLEFKDNEFANKFIHITPILKEYNDGMLNLYRKFGVDAEKIMSSNEFVELQFLREQIMKIWTWKE